MPERLEFDGMELAAIRALFRQFYRRWGYNTLELAGEGLAKINTLVNAELAESWLEGHTVSRTELPFIADAILTLIAEHKDEVLQQLQGNLHSATYAADILARHRNIPVTPLPSLDLASGRGAYLSTIFKNWSESVHRGPTVIVPGIYQLFRLYKPGRELTEFGELSEGSKEQAPASAKGSSIGAYGGHDLRDHVVICELVYVDSDKLECVLITAEGYKYIGSLYINH